MNKDTDSPENTEEVPKPRDDDEVAPKARADMNAPRAATARTSGSTGSLFDLESIRLRQDFAASAPVKKALLTVPVRKPGKQEFFRVHPSESHRLPVGLLLLEESGETYAVTPELVDQLGSDVVVRCLVLVINRQNVLSLWPLAMPDEDGHLHEWGRSALLAADAAKSRWVKMRSNRSLGAYEVEEAMAALPEPVWPEVAFAEIVNIAFRNRIIDSLDHPVIRALKGAR